MTEASISASSSGDNTIVSGVAGQTILVYKILFTLAGTSTVTFKDGASTSLTGAMSNQISYTLDFDGDPWFSMSSGNAFIINLGSAVQASGRVYFRQV